LRDALSHDFELHFFFRRYTQRPKERVAGIDKIGR